MAAGYDLDKIRNLFMLFSTCESNIKDACEAVERELQNFANKSDIKISYYIAAIANRIYCEHRSDIPEAYKELSRNLVSAYREAASELLRSDKIDVQAKDIEYKSV